MLWHKGWLETRWRLSASVAFIVFFLVLTLSVPKTPQTGSGGALTGLIVFTNPSLVIAICTWLAGAGIATQPGFQAQKGLHGSTLVTLSLPVSRLRLLTTRAVLGWVEAAFTVGLLCAGTWIVAGSVNRALSLGDLLLYGGTLLTCASVLYSLSVMLATFLDEQWRVWTTMIVPGALWLTSSRVHLPGAADLFGAMGPRSPLLAHALPWNTMLLSIGLSSVLLFAALKIAQAREY